MIKFEFEAIGTSWVIDINEKLSQEAEVSLFEKIKDRIAVFDKHYSRFRPDSLVMEMAQKSGVYDLPEDAGQMMDLYKKACELTYGLVTPLIGNVLVDAGYDANYSLVKKDLTKPKSWEDVLYWESPKLTLKEPAILDFGACGKGYLVDIVSEILEKAGIKNYCVDAGGDMRQRGSKSLRVGLENPQNTSQVVGVVEVSNQSLCGSAGNRRKWAGMHHIINPESLSSPEQISAVWVLAETTILADILTTCLFFVEPEVLEKYWKFEYLILNRDFSVQKSDNFKAELFT